MSYQVLARKYRPANFSDLEGQEHVLQALINALDNQRLHHAYLFTGTRGVGKTTIARILARCLNCETGITSTPCGECNSCREISEGRSVDLIEVDAASRTGVDDMRELLDNVQYMPTVSRFKIYLIDEVHMLSRSSFNAMLKTLEEPPEHVKFLFATTDPKKLPITVLSRCLQFNLKNMSPEQIVHYLGTVLGSEGIAYDDAALWQLGHAADGSMRDALSLADQAISFGGGEVRDGPVKSMLGAIDQQEVYELLDAISCEDGVRLLERVEAMSVFAPDYEGLLDSLLSVLHRIAIAQAVPGAIDNAQGDRELVVAAASQMSAEQVQLLYQIALIGQRDLSLAPMPRVGFEMVLLRMMSFSQANDKVPTAKPASGTQTASDVSKPASQKSGGNSPIAELLSAVNGEGEKTNGEEAGAPPAAKKSEPASQPESTLDTAAATQEERTSECPDQPDLVPENWGRILELLGLTGVPRTLAANCELASVDGLKCLLRLGESHASLWNQVYQAKIGEAMKTLYGADITVDIEVGMPESETPAQQTDRLREESRAKALQNMNSDEHVQQLIEKFSGHLDEASVTPRASRR